MDSSSVDMESSQSKSAQSLMDAVARTNIEDLRKSLPPDKKLTEGRQYLVRKSKRRAVYWDYFIEYVEDGKLRAECKFCPSTFAADANLNGSKNVKNHSDKCLGNPINKDKGKGKQAELHFQPGEGNNEDGDGRLKYGSVNVKDVRDALTYMIIVDELPFRFVERAGFKHLMNVVCPRFNIPSRTTVARDCLQLYHNEKSKLKDMLKGTSGNVRSEFERYLNEQLGEEEEADALIWWGRNGHRYPIVSRMARDILAIPLSTVASESAFSAGGRHLDQFRSSLTPKMAQALICSNDWLRVKGMTGIDMEENLRELEEVEKEFQGAPLGEDEDVVYVDSFI